MTKKIVLTEKTAPPDNTPDWDNMPPPPPDPPDWDKHFADPHNELDNEQPKVNNVAVRISDEVFAALEDKAAALGISNSVLLRRLINTFLLPEIAIKRLEKYRPVFDKDVPYDFDAAIEYTNQLSVYLSVMQDLKESYKFNLAKIEDKSKMILDAIGQVSTWEDEKSRSDRIQRRKEGEIIP